MGSHQKKWPASGAWLGAAPVLTVRDSGGAATCLGGAERGDSAAGDGSSVRRRAGLFAEQRGRGKREGQVGEPARAG
jgi:hypothetical protein